MRGVHHLGGLASAGASLKGAGKGGRGTSQTIRVPTGSGAYSSAFFSTPGTNPRSIAIDPVSGNLISHDLNSYTIHVHDGVSDTVLSTFPAPGSSIYFEDMEVDPVTGNLLLLAGNDGGKLYIQDGISATTLQTISGVGSAGMTLREGNLITSSGRTIRFHDGISSTVLSSYSINANLDQQLRLCMDFTGTYLVSSGRSGSAPTIIFLNPEDGTLAAGFNTTPIGRGIATTVEGDLVLLNDASDRIYTPTMEDGFIVDGKLYVPAPERYTNEGTFR